MPRITIVGLGLIGTSLGLALKKHGLSNVEILGYEVEREAAIRSKRIGAVDGIERYLPAAVEKSDMVVIATPVLAIRDVLETIAPHLTEGTVVTDTGSTKTQVLNWALEHLDSSISFVGGHPMAGKTESGPDGADADLFVGAPYCILPGRNATPTAVQVITDLALMIEAVPYFVDPLEHDTYVAAISHLPIAISAAMVATISRSPSWKEMARLAAGGFRDTTRLAQGDPIMNRDIFLTNQEAITHWIDELIKELYEVRTILREGGTDLTQKVQDFFFHAWENRTDWVTGAVQRQTNLLDEMPKAGESLARMMAGEWVMRKFEIDDRTQDRKIRDKQLSKLREKKKGWFKR